MIETAVREGIWMAQDPEMPGFRDYRGYSAVSEADAINDCYRRWDGTKKASEHGCMITASMGCRPGHPCAYEVTDSHCQCGYRPDIDDMAERIFQVEKHVALIEAGTTLQQPAQPPEK